MGPKNQSIEPWYLFNTLKKSKESFRVFPISQLDGIKCMGVYPERGILKLFLYILQRTEKVVVVANKYFFMMIRDTN